jgi:protease-4
MQPQSDLLIDRKRLKGQLVGWRTAALMLLFLFFISQLDGSKTNVGGRVVGGDYIARITIEGVMVDDLKRDELMKKIRDDVHVKAVIVRMDSPGGTTVGGEEVFLQLREIAKKKPVVGTMRTVCASACYMASLAADHVLAREGTLTGSIGVLMQSFEVSRLADKLGVTSITVKSGAYKDVPSMAEPFTDEQRGVVNQLIADAYDRFVSMIVERRKMEDATVRQLADGRVYTGHQAFNLKLIDAIGGEEEALVWLTEKRSIDKKLEIVDVKQEEEFQSLVDQLAQSSGIKIFEKSSIGLDGLVSIWHPSAI